MKKYLLLTPFLMFVSAFLLHFIYDIFNQNILIGFISPINESIFEHTKLILTPLTICYGYYYIKNKNYINSEKYMFVSLISILLGIISVPMYYYTYTQALGINVMIIDIIITYLSLITANIFFLNYYNNYEFKIKKNITIIIYIVIFIFYIYASLYQINLPIFIPN
ncbi:MAG: DUF6512 family protein [bacterium]